MLPKEDGLEAAFSLESEKGGIIEDAPFHILMLGDWGGDAPKPALKDRRPIEIDRDNFDEVMSRLGVTAKVGEMTLNFASIEDLHADELFRNVPAFAEMRGLRKRLRDADTFGSAAREVRSMMGTEPQRSSDVPDTPPADGGGLLDAILSGGKADAKAFKEEPGGDLGALIGELVRPHLVSVDEDEQSQIVSAVDEAIGDLMRKILHDRRFKEIEAAWRGLHFQVRRTETSGNLRIFIFDISKDELATDLKGVSDLGDSSIFKLFSETPGDVPWAVVCGNFAFEPTVDDAAALIRISQIAGSVNAPFVSHIRPDVLGVHSLADHPDHREWRPDENAAKLWAAVRGQPEARYFGVVMPRFLARLPYGEASEPLEAFSFEEFKRSVGHEDYCWANPCFLAGLLFGKSFAEFEWDLEKGLTQDLEDLPLHIYKDGTETIYQSPAEVQLSQAAADTMMEMGIMPLVSFKNTDRVRIARFQSISDPVRALRGRWE